MSNFLQLLVQELKSGLWSLDLRLRRFEDSFDHEEHRRWMEVIGWKVAVISSAIYVLLVFIGPRLMQDVKEWKVDRVLIGWNASLAVFSFVSLFRSIHWEFMGVFHEKGVVGTYCYKGSMYEGQNGFWSWLYFLSKILEFGDTAFLIVRKRKVQFVHWYHHAVVVVCTWPSYIYAPSTIRLGIWMNLVVHLVMYTYFVVKAFCYLPRFVSMIVTSLQLTQFMVGTWVGVETFVREWAGWPICDVQGAVRWIQLGLYASFLLVFAQFFYTAYLRKPAATSHAKQR